MTKAVVTNKGKTREVYLPGKLCKRLREYAKARGVVSGPVLVTRGGQPLDRSNLWREMKALCREAKVAAGKVFPHNLRHLFARTYYNAERDLARLADILGYASVDKIGRAACRERGSRGGSGRSCGGVDRSWTRQE